MNKTLTIFWRPIWKDNPINIQMLGICSALAVTVTAENRLCHGPFHDICALLFQFHGVGAAKTDSQKHPDHCGAVHYLHLCDPDG